jgi:tripartite-type tricarboxylate transporter receptor subunit TctC
MIIRHSGPPRSGEPGMTNRLLEPRMSLLRRKVLLLSLGAAAWPVVSPIVRADVFSARPLHIVAGFPPGGVGDVAARLIAPSLQQQLGQSVVVDDRPGAGGNIAAEAVVKARPDGGTLLVAAANDAINATLYKNLTFDFIHDIAMVAGIIQSPLVMLTNPSFAAKSVAEFISYAKANPGKINMASAGNGTSTHLAGELFQMMTGVSMVHVPYRGAEAARADLVAGRVQIMFGNVVTSVGLIGDGRLRALAVTSAHASPVLPGIPPLAAVVPGYEVIAWYALGAPKATPAATVAVLNKAVNACLAEPAIANRMRELGGEPMVMSPRELDAFVAAETKKWAAAVKFSGATVD